MEWKKTNTIGNYEINKNAVVRNANTLYTIKPFKHKSGYLYVTMCEKGKHHNYRLHRLVAMAFIPNPDNKEQVNHIDCNKENNCVSNLEWSSAKENNKHARENIVFKRPIVDKEERIRRSRNAYLKTCVSVARYKDGKLIDTFESISEASRKTNTCRRSIQDRILGKIKGPLKGYEWSVRE